MGLNNVFVLVLLRVAAGALVLSDRTAGLQAKDAVFAMPLSAAQQTHLRRPMSVLQAFEDQAGNRVKQVPTGGQFVMVTTASPASGTQTILVSSVASSSPLLTTAPPMPSTPAPPILPSAAMMAGTDASERRTRRSYNELKKEVQGIRELLER